MTIPSADKLIASILKHDAKQNTYKIALLRAINDVVFAYPGMLNHGMDVAIPLRMLARHWIAYYWAFADTEKPVYQSSRWKRGGKLVNDVAFRPELTRLRQEWEKLHSISETSDREKLAADGFSLTTSMLVPRKVKQYRDAASDLVREYKQTLRRVMKAIEQPTRYAGTDLEGEHAVFTPRAPLQTFEQVTAIPGTKPDDECIVIPAAMWEAFQELSLYVEALCIYEWSLFIESVDQKVEERTTVERGEVFQLLTARPDNRISLTWERNRVDLLMHEGAEFRCIWTGRPLHANNYAMDHLIPVSVYPMNEMWNLIPTHSSANRQKSDKIPVPALLEQAQMQLMQSYQQYQKDDSLDTALREDSQVRFSLLKTDAHFTKSLAHETVQFMEQIAQSRSLARIERFS